MALLFDPEAATRWTALNESNQRYEREVRHAVATVLRHLAEHPQRHRIGATQFATTPTTWARTVDVNAGAAWIIIWTIDTAQDIRILRIEPAPSF